MCEELSAYEEDTLPTRHAQIRVFSGKGVARDVFSRCLEDLRYAVEVRDAAAAVCAMQGLIPEYQASCRGGAARYRAGSLAQGIIVDRESPGGAGRGPVHDGEDFSRARIFPH